MGVGGIIIGIVLCAGLHFFVKRTQEIGKLKACSVINIICLVINSILLLVSIRNLIHVLLIGSQLNGMVLSGFVAVLLWLTRVALVVWHIILIKSAGNRKEEIQKEENTIQVVYCNHCGIACPEGAVFCRMCGKKIEYKENGQ